MTEDDDSVGGIPFYLPEPARRSTPGFRGFLRRFASEVRVRMRSFVVSATALLLLIGVAYAGLSALKNFPAEELLDRLEAQVAAVTAVPNGSETAEKGPSIDSGMDPDAVAQLIVELGHLRQRLRELDSHRPPPGFRVRMPVRAPPPGESTYRVAELMEL